MEKTISDALMITPNIPFYYTILWKEIKAKLWEKLIPYIFYDTRQKKKTAWRCLINYSSDELFHR
jgi:hypothetical protein